jgi:hypothetical protein
VNRSPFLGPGRFALASDAFSPSPAKGQQGFGAKKGPAVEQGKESDVKEHDE